MPTVWPYWIDQGTTGTATTTAWNAWIQGTSAVTYPQQAVWVQWQTQTTATTPIYFGTTAAPPPPPLTTEQIAEREARRERECRERARHGLIYRNRERAKQLRRRPAERKAEALLLENLSEAQRDEWQAERAFTVLTADGKRAYKIAYGLAGNVRLIKADESPVGKGRHPIRVGARFCMHVYHPDGWVPNEDNVLAQKLLIESNEDHFLALANVS